MCTEDTDPDSARLEQLTEQIADLQMRLTWQEAETQQADALLHEQAQRLQAQEKDIERLRNSLGQLIRQLRADGLELGN